jgi:peptidoglycan hydrolase-like protein with peptidoglycan-binding domain
MLPSRVTLQLLAFLLLSGGVIANVFFLQSRGRGSEAGRGGDTAWNLSLLQTAEFGDTGSIAKPGNEGAVPALASAVDASESLSAKDLARAVQRELQIRGYETGSRDGVVGVMTRGAILAYEHDHRLPLTARPSQELLKAIVLGESGKRGEKLSKETAEARDVIRTVQRQLAKLRYKPGSATGKLTPETARAIRAFEADQALPESGRVSGPLIARLGRLTDEGRVASAP